MRVLTCTRPWGTEVAGEGEWRELGVHFGIEFRATRTTRDQPSSVELSDVKTVSSCP